MDSTHRLGLNRADVERGAQFLAVELVEDVLDDLSAVAAASRDEDREGEPGRDRERKERECVRGVR